MSVLPNGSVIQIFQQMIEKNPLHDKLAFKADFCTKMCDQAGLR